MARRKFTREFKVSAVKLVNEQGYSIPEAARSLGVDPNCVRGWVDKFSSEVGLAPVGEGAMAAATRGSVTRMSYASSAVSSRYLPATTPPSASRTA